MTLTELDEYINKVRDCDTPEQINLIFRGMLDKRAKQLAIELLFALSRTQQEREHNAHKEENTKDTNAHALT